MGIKELRGACGSQRMRGERATRRWCCACTQTTNKYTCMHTSCTHVHTRTRTHAHARSLAHTHTHTHTHSQSHVHMYVYMSYVHHLLSHTNTASSPPRRSRRHAAEKGDSAANSAQKKQKQAATLHRDVLVRPPAQRCPNPHHQSGEI